MDKPAIDEHVESSRRETARIAAAIIAGTVDVLEASIQMHRLKWQVGIDEEDQDFAAFSLVDSEIRRTAGWTAAPVLVERGARAKRAGLEHARAWARSTVEDECRNIVARFGG